MMLVIPTLPVAFIETYTFLSYFSMAGLLVALCSIIAIFVAIGTGEGCDSEKFNCEVKVFDGKNMLGHVGLAILMFEGNAAVFNIRAEAGDKKAYPRIVTYTVGSFLVLYVGLATMGYLAFRDQTAQIFTMSFQPTGLI